MEIREKVKAIVMRVLNVESISDEAKRQDYGEWDSLAYLSIIANLENEFNVQVTPENINNFDSIPNILKEIEHVQNNR